MEAQIPLKEPRPEPRRMPMSLSDRPVTRRPRAEVDLTAVELDCTGYVWKVNGARIADLEIRHSDCALLIWDRHHARQYDTGHRFNLRPGLDELLDFVRYHAVNLMGALLAQETATAEGWRD